MILYGKNSVCERLKAHPASIKKLALLDTFKEPGIEELIKKSRVQLERVSAKELARVKPAKDLQGMVAKADDFQYAPFHDILAEEKKRTLVFLDNVTDPQNLGVIIRVAACFGGFAIAIPKHNACGMNETVLHVASGGENYAPVSMVTNLSNAIISAKKAGYWIMGAVADENAQDVTKVSLPFPLALVLGSEGKGIRYGIDKHLDIKAVIPMKGAALSFNVNIASAIFCYEIAKQRK